MKLAILGLSFGCLIFAACSAGPQKVEDKTVETKNTAQKTDPNTADNPLLKTWDTPFGSPPFDQIKNEHYLPAVKAAMAVHNQEIQAIAESKEDPSFENTVAALDYSGKLLSQVSYVFFGQLSAHTNDELNEIAKTVSPMLSKHQDDILLNAKLFARIKAVHEQRAHRKNPEHITLLENLYRDFVRGGANLDAKQQARLRKINQELSLLYLAFGQNILKEVNKFEMHLTDKAELAGLPEGVITAAAKAAQDRGKEAGWVFTLDKPSFIPFLQYSGIRSLREKILKAYAAQGANGGELDNRENIKKILALRLEKAKLMGHASWADFMLEDRMAKQPAKVYELLQKVWQAALPRAQQEAKELQALIKREKKDFALQAWDWWYYAEKLRKEKYNLDEEELRPYFKLENVIAGVFEVATKLYGIQFVEHKDIPKYHEDVRTFEVTEKDGRHIGILYVDYFPRKSKRGGAWCGGYRGQYKKADGTRVAPIITNVGNFTKPTADKPSLLSFEEVTTLFHEFGHALHFLLVDTQFEASAEYVKVDFVELPSQIMENWASEPEVLKLYARHYETNEPMPDALIQKIQNAQYFNQGFSTVEYLAASFLDMDWHTLKEMTKDLNVDLFEKESLDKIGLINEIIVRYKSPYFRHIFSSDFYSAGYYSYIWAAVLDADAFEAFKQAGLFDAKTAQSFRQNILAPGGAEDPMVLYKRFRGADPKIEPLLKRRGLIK